MGLRRIRPRRVLPDDHRLADLSADVHRPGPARAEDGPVEAPACRCGPLRAHPSLRPRVQYRAQRYAQTLAEAHAVASVGSKGDSYDNAMAEALNALSKAELIHLDGPWHGRADVERATAEWVHWFNIEGIHSMLDYNWKNPGDPGSSPTTDPRS